jgi:hypothetical protein
MIATQYIATKKKTHNIQQVKENEKRELRIANITDGSVGRFCTVGYYEMARNVVKNAC